MGRLLPLLPLAALLAAGCKSPTEIVLFLDAPSGVPSAARVQLHRSTPFNENPMTPPFVTPALNGADLNLDIVPQGEHTTLSLLQGNGNPSDLTLTVTSPGFDVDPAGPQESGFKDGISLDLHFTLTPATPPDMAMPRDMARSSDGGAPKG